MEPVWLQHYPQSVPAEVDIFRFASLKSMLEQRCGRFRERPASTNMGVTLSFSGMIGMPISSTRVVMRDASCSWARRSRTAR